MAAISGLGRMHGVAVIVPDRVTAVPNETSLGLMMCTRNLCDPFGIEVSEMSLGDLVYERF